MKRFLLFFAFLTIPLVTKAQDPVLYDYDWYLWELTIDGVSMTPPSNAEVEHVQLYFQDEEPDYFETVICNSLFGNVTIDTSTMTFFDMGITLMDCTDPDNSAFEFPYFDFFFLHAGVPFDLTIGIIDSPEDGDGNFIILTNPEGDTAFYGDKPALSIPENDLSGFNVYPNPAAQTLTWTATNTGAVTVRIYSAQGKRIKSEITTLNSIDVSALSSGLYFIELQDEQAISRTKFIKR